MAKVRVDETGLFGKLPVELFDNLRSINPWWQNQPSKPFPPYHRWIFDRLLRSIQVGIAPVTVLRGPRRVGKTVLLRQLIERLIRDGTPARQIFYVPFDELKTLRQFQEPVLSLARWFEDHVLGETFNAAAQAGKKVYLLFDEVQNLDTWAPQVKNLVDNHGVRVLLTGSSSFRIEAGKDSLAGRLTQLDLGPLLLREIAALTANVHVPTAWPDNGLDELCRLDFWHDAIRLTTQQVGPRRAAFAAFSERGGYPDSQEFRDRPWPEVASHLTETVIKRAIAHDLRMGKRGAKRDERLLEEVFRLACRYAGQCPGASTLVAEIRQSLFGNIGVQRVMQYLKFLDGTLLLRLIQPLELRLKKRKAAPKICVCDHSLRAAWLQEIIPLDPDKLAAEPHLSNLAGHIAESILGYFFSTMPNLETAHFPARGNEPEVDFVLTIGTRRIPVEVKYRRRIQPLEDTIGLRAFLEKTVYNAPLALLVTLDDGVTVPDPRIVPISLSSLLWLR